MVEDGTVPRTERRFRPLRLNWERIAPWCGFALLCLSVGVFVRMNAKRQAKPTRQRLEVVNLSGMGMSPGMGGQRRGANGLGGFIERSGPNRYFGNLATRTGNFYVSVRFVMGDSFQRSLFSNPPADQPPAPPPPAWNILVQVMSEDPKETGRIREFAPQLIAEDDRGRRVALKLSETMTGVADQYTILRMHALLSSEARYLRSLEGEITLGPPNENNVQRLDSKNGTNDPEWQWKPHKAATGERLPFRLTNIPLPRLTRVFGTVGVAYLTMEQLGRPFAAEGVQTITDAPILTQTSQFAFRGAKPLELPTRLIMHPGIPTSFQPHLPPDTNAKPSVGVRVTPTLGADGEIALETEIADEKRGGVPLRANLRCWSGEPMALVLPPSFSPPSAPPKTRLVLRLRLSLDPFADVAPNAIARTPFPANGAERGGVVTGSARILDEPMRYGELALEMRKAEGAPGQWGKAARVLITLDRDGAWKFPNVAPGRYQVSLKEFKPYRTQMARRSALPDYLYRRYAIRRHTVQNAIQSEVEVRPGGIVALRPFRTLEATTAQTAHLR